MQDDGTITSRRHNRRSFLRTGLAATGAATVGTALLARATEASAQAGGLTAGDIAMLQFLAAGEAIEADFYTQYNELGGIQDSEVPGGTGNPIFTHQLKRIDRNFSQYIHDTADDEISHQNFLNAYLVRNGAAAVDMEPFRTLPGSTATGSSRKLRLTNLMQPHHRHELVDAISERHEQSGPQSNDVRAGGPGSAQRPVHGNSENRR